MNEVPASSRRIYRSLRLFLVVALLAVLLGLTDTVFMRQGSNWSRPQAVKVLGATVATDEQNRSEGRSSTTAAAANASNATSNTSRDYSISSWSQNILDLWTTRQDQHLTTNTDSPDGVWRRFDKKLLGESVTVGLPANAQVIKLNAEVLTAILNRAPKESNEAKQRAVVLTLPLPGGGYERFRLIDSPIMEPGMMKRFPEIKSFRGQGIDNPRLSMRCDWSLRGFNATIMLEDKMVGIHPVHWDDVTTYVASFGDAVRSGDDTFECGFDEAGRLSNETDNLLAGKSGIPSELSVGPSLRTFRIAVATSQEYTNDPGLGGGTVASTVASINTWLNAVNAIYERELATRLVLVNNTNIIFTAENDGITNGSTNTALGEIRPILATQVGLANYDVGHVLLNVPGGGGVANGPVVCRTDDLKGAGVTQVGAPTGNFSGVHVFAHELGHQFGASHSWNACLGSEGQRAAGTAYEVGSGFTIMSYGGVCTTDNIVANRVNTELRFHAGSYTQITNYIASTTCAVSTSTSNSPPTVDAGINYTIPKNTPFTLTASASDPNAGDITNLTYVWEQMDAGGATYTSPPYDDSGDTSATTRPIFRAYSPTTNPTRTFPKLSYILDYANDPPDFISGLRPGEELPRIGRTLNFRVTARDNRSGGGGVNDDSIVLTVDSDSGPFLVTVPNTGVTWAGGSSQTVTWSVNNTNAAPINCSNVKILLSTDGGNTFPITLAASTANDGSESVTLPNGIQSSTARIKVQSIGNIFFDIADANFTLTAGATCPAVTRITPQAGNIGATVTITGVNFTGVNAVKFSNNVSASFTVDSDTQITATVPSGAVGGPITLSESGCADAQSTTFAVCSGGSTTMSIDDGGINFTNNAAYAVNRLTPSSYPATLTHVQVYNYGESDGPPIGTPLVIIAGANTDGDSNVNGTITQQVSGTVYTRWAYNTYEIAPITITSGDFVVGFGLDSSWTTRRVAGDGDLPNAGRSYTSGDATSFSLETGTNANLMIRGQYLTGCTIVNTIAPTSQDLLASGGSGVVNVNAIGAWTATSNDGWISITLGATGSDNGTVNYSVAVNTSGVARTGTITIAGQTFTVTQAACAATISPGSRTHNGGVGGGTVDIASPSGCPWTATSNAPTWLTVTAGCSGASSTLVVDDGGHNNTRNGPTYYVNRLTPSSYPATLTHVQIYFYEGSGGPSVGTAINVIAGSTTTTGGTITNPIVYTASDTVQVVGQFKTYPITPITISTGDFVVGYFMASGLAGAPMVMDNDLPDNERSYSSSNGTTFSLDSGFDYMIRATYFSGCAASSGTGDGSAIYAVSPNNTGSQRTGTMTIAGQTFTVTQQACAFSLSPTSQTLGGGTGTGTVNVTTSSGCTWTATSNDSFISVTSGASGTGNGSVGYSLLANNTGSQRSGTITIAGQTFTVTQQACSSTLSPTSRSHNGGVSGGIVAVTSASGCAWTASSNALWLTVTAGCTGAVSTLSVDSGSITHTSGGGAYYVNRLTPSSYPATLTQVTIYWYGADGNPPVGTPFTVLAGTNTDGNADINNTSFQVTNATVQSLFQFNSYDIAPITINSGDFVIGFFMSANIGRALAREQTAPIIGRSYSSEYGTIFNADSGSDYMIRGSYFQGCSAASGVGNGTTIYSVAANNTGSSRSGTITVGGQTFTVNQDACAGTISPTSRTHTGGIGGGTVNVTSPSCAWSAASNDAWITVSSGCSGGVSPLVIDTGSITNTRGSGSYYVNRLTPTSYPATLTQVSIYWYGSSGGGPPTNTPFTILTGTNTDGDTTINNTSFQSTSATVQSQFGFTTYEVTPITIGSGDFVIGFFMPASPSYAALAMEQTDPDNDRSYLSSNGTTFSRDSSFDYMIRGSYYAGCSPTTGTGNGAVIYSVAANNSGAQRSGTMTISGQTFTVTQASPGTLQFASAPYSDSETNTDHTFTVNVSRTGGSSGAVAVNYAVTDGTATIAGNDYTVSPASGTLSWADADTANKTFTITIKGDTTFEPNETINLTLSAPTGSALIGTPNPTTLTIVNDEPRYRSFASGNWNANSTWEVSTDGSTWAAATSTPTSSSADTITIRSPHSVTVSANVNANQLVVNSGATLSIDTGVTLTIDDAAGTDLTVDGTANVNGTGVVAGAGSFTLSAGGSLGIGSTSGITSAAGTGSVQVTGARSFNAAASYTYNGNSNQAVGNQLPSSVANLTIANAGTINKTVTGNPGQIVTGLLRIQSGIYSSASDYVDVDIIPAGTLSLAANITVSGNWTNNGTFISNGFGVTFDGTNNQSISGSSATSFAPLTISNTGGSGNNAVTLSQDISDTALNITSGVFDQGTASSLSSGPAAVSSGATWRNLGTGDLTLSGDVSNVGTINFNANGTTCGQADDILIRSSVNGTPRTWAGAGTFSMTDVNARDQKVPTAPGPPLAIIATSSTDATGNTGWVFTGDLACTSGNYTWSGGASQDWTVPTNWSPTRTTLNAADILIIDGNITPSPIITNVANVVGNNETIAKLRVINGATPTFSTAASNTLTINAGSGNTGFELGSLAITGSNPLTISLAAGTLGNVTGFMSVAGGAHRLIAASANAITFQSGSIFTTSTGFTGNAFGTATAGSVIFAGSSDYFHNAGSSPFGTGASVVVFQTGSEAHFLTATGFEASGRTYADLAIGQLDPGGVAVDVSASGTANFQFDNLTINAKGTTNSSLTFTGSGSNTITIQGNITSNGPGTGTLPDVTLTPGSGGISINNGGPITFGNDGSNARSIRWEGNATVTSGTTLNLARKLQLGLAQPNSFVLTVDGNINGGASGYVIGAVRKSSVPNGSFTFPVGKATEPGYTPVALTNATSSSANLTVKPVPANQSLLNDATSLDEYWTLTLNSGTLTTDLTFSYLEADVDGNESLYRIIRVQGATAVSFPNTCPSGAACVETTGNTATIKGLNAFSDWTLGEPAAPTAVQLTSFKAESYADGVELNWESGFEVNNLGYHVYREHKGRRTRVTPSVVAGSALTVGEGMRLTAGYSYTWFDAQGTAASAYSLEAIDLDGSSEWAGPVYPSAEGETRRAPRHERAMLLSEIGANGEDLSWVSSWPTAESMDFRWSGNGKWRGEMGQSATQPPHSNDGPDVATVPQSLTIQQAIAAGKAVKVEVRQSGWYRLTQPELVAAGFDPNSDARTLQLYVEGEEVPISLSGDGVQLGSRDTLEFYGVGLNTLTSDRRVYWLVSGNETGKRMIARRGKLNPADPNSEIVSGSFDLTVERREKLVYFSSLLNGEAENIFGASVRSAPVTQSLVLKNIDRDSASQPRLEVALQGLTSGVHSVQLQVNGTSVGTMAFANTEHPMAQFSVNPALLREGENVVSLASMNGQSDVSLIDWVRLSYPHKYKAENNSLRFSALGGQPVKLEGFSSPNLRVVDVTDPNSPTQLASYAANSGDAYAITVQPAGTGVRTLIAVTEEHMGHPVSISANQPSSWNAGTNGADVVIITHQDFRHAVEPLASLRRSQGLNVAVIDIEDVYDEFSYGAHTPEAIRSFLKSAAANWSRKPAYLLLVGDSSWDPRNYLGKGANDFVPTKLIDTQGMETGSDDWLADFTELGLATMAIGRLPARTAAEANLMVSKILAYEQERDLNAPLRGALMVADRGFEPQSSQTGTLLPSNVTVQTINRAEVGNDDMMRGQIVNALNQGPMIVNYYGHGSVRVWTGAGLLNSDLAGALTNANRLSVYVMMTCLNGYASDANIDSLGEAALKAPNGGAVAVWASSGFTTPQPQFEMNSEFYRLLFAGQPIRLGEAARSAKAATSDIDVRRTWILLGDPAMRVR